MAAILHLVDEATWRALPPAASTFSPASLATEGFVHCTAGDAVLLRVANRLYRGEPGPFLVLTLDTDRLRAEVRWEPGVPAPPPGDEALLFPHVLGPLDVAAVVEVRRAERDAGGAFVGFAPLA